MAGMQTIETQGTRFFWSTSTGLSTANEIKGCRTMSGLGGSSPVINVSDSNSTVMEKRIGLRDAGEITLAGNYNPSTTVNAALRLMEEDSANRNKRKFCLKFSTVGSDGVNGMGLKVDSYSGGVTLDMGEDDVWKFSAQLVLAAGASHTTFST